MTNLDLSSLLERYEKARQQCLRYANLHPDEKAPCGTALSKVRTLPAITFHLAELLDDMAIALRLVHEPTVTNLRLREALRKLIDATVRADNPSDCGVGPHDPAMEEACAALREADEPRENPQWSPEEIARMRMEQAINTCQGCFRPVSACVCSQLSRT